MKKLIVKYYNNYEGQAVDPLTKRTYFIKHKNINFINKNKIISAVIVLGKVLDFEVM